MKKIHITACCLLSAACCLLLIAPCFAEKITVLYTGQTHASLYHCDCPKEPDGGLSRRMAKIAQLRQENPHTLLLDAGGFFSGGMFDEHSQGVELDKTRNDIQLAAMGLMGYDAAVIGDDELNFGRDYLSEKIKKSKLPLLSANLKLDGLKPYIVKKISGVNIAVIGLTNEQAKVKSAGAELTDAVPALLRTIREVKKNNADLVLVLSYLGEEKDKALLNEVKDVDILISGRPQDPPENYSRIGSAYLVRPVWQGRRLSKIDLELENRKIKSLKLEQIRLSKEIPDAGEIAKILPRCFSDADCLENGVKGRCSSPSQLQSSCSYDKPKKIQLLIVQPAGLQVLHQEQFIGFLKSLFPGIEPRVVDSDSSEGKSLVEKSRAKLLPLYLLAKEADAEAGFKKILEFIEAREGYYYLSPRLAGGSIFVGRERIPGRLDVFLGSSSKDIKAILSRLKELEDKHKGVKVNIHYLAVEGQGVFSAPGGLFELEEDIRQVCAMSYGQDKFWDYALCRAEFKESSWWEVCAEAHKLDAKKIKKCALSDEGVNLLRENTKLNKELEIASGPTLLVDNSTVFALSGVPDLEALEKIAGLKRE